MERWHLTLLLLGAAAVGALVAPNLPLPGRAPAQPPPPVIPEATTPEPLTGKLDPVSAAEGDLLSIDARLDRDALRGESDVRWLVVTVTAPRGDGERVPVDLALVVDASGSMGQQGKIEQARAAADELVDALRPGDRFALVSFDDRAHLLAEGARYDGDSARLHRLVDGLRDDGGTNLWDGLAAGRGELDTERRARKVLVVSDGNANVGETDPAAFARLAHSYASDGVSVSAIGLGRDFNETLLEGMADAGGGTYRFVGHPEELPTVIAAELERTTQTLARRVKVRVQAAEGVVIREVYGWKADTTAGVAEVDVGEMAAGQSRKIVLAVDVPTERLGERNVARADVSWEPVDAGPSGFRGTAGSLVVVADAAEVEVDEAATVAATRARAGALTQASADAWRRGDGHAARRMMSSARAVIAEAQEEVDAPALRQDAARFRVIETLEDSEGSSYAAKAASEASRDLAR